MASFLDIKPKAGKLEETALMTARSRAVLTAAQLASPRVIQAAQRIFQAADFYNIAFGTPVEDSPMALLGGITPKKAMEIMKEIRGINLSRKNLWFLRVTDPSAPKEKQNQEVVQPLEMFDMLAQNVSYSPHSIQGEKINLGSATMDRVTGTDGVDIQITTLDDAAGTIKRWFDGKAKQVAAMDGTVGLPVNYCVDIEIVHGTPSEGAYKSSEFYRSHIRMRPVSIQHELSRTEQGFEELQMTFTQFDSFFPGR